MKTDQEKEDEYRFWMRRLQRQWETDQSMTVGDRCTDNMNGIRSTQVAAVIRLLVEEGILSA